MCVCVSFEWFQLSQLALLLFVTFGRALSEEKWPTSTRDNDDQCCLCVREFSQQHKLETNERMFFCFKEKVFHCEFYLKDTHTESEREETKSSFKCAFTVCCCVCVLIQVGKISPSFGLTSFNNNNSSTNFGCSFEFQ